MGKKIGLGGCQRFRLDGCLVPGTLDNIVIGGLGSGKACLQGFIYVGERTQVSSRGAADVQDQPAVGRYSAKGFPAVAVVIQVDHLKKTTVSAAQVDAVIERVFCKDRGKQAQLGLLVPDLCQDRVVDKQRHYVVIDIADIVQLLADARGCGGIELCRVLPRHGLAEVVLQADGQRCRQCGGEEKHRYHCGANGCAQFANCPGHTRPCGLLEFAITG